MDNNNSKHIRLLTVRQKMVLASVALGLVAGVVSSVCKHQASESLSTADQV